MILSGKRTLFLSLEQHLLFFKLKRFLKRAPEDEFSLHSCCWYSGLAFRSHTRPLNNNTGQRISTKKRTWRETSNRSNTVLLVWSPSYSASLPERCWRCCTLGCSILLTAMSHKNTFCLLRRVQFFHSNRRIWEPVFIAPQLYPWRGSWDCNKPADTQLHQWWHSFG